MLAGCSVTTEKIVHHETQHHINENTEAFRNLVNTIRRNAKVTRPTPELKNELNILAYQAGLVPQCEAKYGCYLVRPGFSGRIKIDFEFITIDYVDRHVKIGDVNEATAIIYS